MDLLAADPPLLQKGAREGEGEDSEAQLAVDQRRGRANLLAALPQDVEGVGPEGERDGRPNSVFREKAGEVTVSGDID